MSIGDLTVDLNADLGEGAATDEEMIPLISSTSVACGGHAGDAETMTWVRVLATAHGVTIGAHPSYPDRAGFGRRDLDWPGDALYRSLQAQVAELSALAPIRFVKPHGALYNRAAVDAAVAELIVSLAEEFDLVLLCPGRSEMARQASNSGLAWRAEAFADRAYLPDGTLAPRSQPGSVLSSPAHVASRAVELARSGRVRDVNDDWLDVPVDSICVHGDSPGALGLARAVRAGLEEAGVGILAFAG